MCAIVLVDVAFYSAIAPLLPTYKDDLDLTKSEAGILTGSYAFGTLVASLPAGYLAARWGARRTLVLGLGLLAVACVGFGLSERYELLVAARLLQGFGGAGAWAAGLAWLIGVAPREQRGAMIGTALGFAVAGALGGPVLGALAEATSAEVVFPAVGVVVVTLLVLVVLTPVEGDVPSGGRLGDAVRSPVVRTGAWLTLSAALFFGTFGVLTPLRLDDFGVGAAGVAAVFLVSAGAEAVVSPIVGRISDRTGRLVPLRIGLVSMVVFCLLLPLPGSAGPLALVVILAALVTSVVWAPASAMISDGAEAAGLPQGIAFGLFNLAWAGGQVGGAAGSAALADATSDTVPYLVIAASAAVTLAVLVRGAWVGRAHAPAGRS